MAGQLAAAGVPGPRRGAIGAVRTAAPSGPATAGGCWPGRAHPLSHPGQPDTRVSAAHRLAAPGRPHGQPQAGLPGAQAQGVVGPSALGHPTPPRPRAWSPGPRRATSAGRWTSPTSPAGRTAGRIWPPSSTATTARSIGLEFALRGRAKEAERALEEACLKRFGTLRPQGPTPIGALRQRPDLSVPPLPSGLQGLPASPGVHHALHPRAERHHRALLPHPQGRVRLAAQLHRFHPRTKGGHRPGFIATTPGARTRLSATGAPPSTAPNNSTWWLDVRGSLQAASRRCSPPTRRWRSASPAWSPWSGGCEAQPEGGVGRRRQGHTYLRRASRHIFPDPRAYTPVQNRPGGRGARSPIDPR